jgi:hypothetical protein
MTQGNTGPRRVVIFDRPGSDRGGLGLRERIAACYRFARSNGWSVTEVCDGTGRTAAAELDRAVIICKRTGAGLLVYRAELLGRHRIGATPVVHAATVGSPT